MKEEKRFDIYEEKKCERCGCNFKANRLIHGDNVCRTCEGMCSMTFWLPPLIEAQFPMPKTIMVNADTDPSEKGSERFFDELKRACDILGYPVDLKTPNDLSHYFREDVLAKAKTIYGE